MLLIAPLAYADTPAAPAVVTLPHVSVPNTRESKQYETIGDRYSIAGSAAHAIVAKDGTVLGYTYDRDSADTPVLYDENGKRIGVIDTAHSAVVYGTREETSLPNSLPAPSSITPAPVQTVTSAGFSSYLPSVTGGLKSGSTYAGQLSAMTYEKNGKKYFMLVDSQGNRLGYANDVDGDYALFDSNGKGIGTYDPEKKIVTYDAGSSPTTSGYIPGSAVAVATSGIPAGYSSANAGDPTNKNPPEEKILFGMAGKDSSADSTARATKAPAQLWVRFTDHGVIAAKPGEEGAIDLKQFPGLEKFLTDNSGRLVYEMKRNSQGVSIVNIDTLRAVTNSVDAQGNGKVITDWASDGLHREETWVNQQPVASHETVVRSTNPNTFDDDRRVEKVQKYIGNGNWQTISEIEYQKYLTADAGQTIVRQIDKPVFAKLAGGGTLDYETGRVITGGIGQSPEAYLQEHPEAQQQYNQVKSARRNYNFKDTLEAVQFYGTEYRGLSGFSSLFFDDDTLAKWHKTIEDSFCTTILLGGIDCWTSKICQKYDSATPGLGVVIGQAPVGQEPVNIAHIEAERSKPALLENGTTGVLTGEYLYKITYFVKNPDGKQSLTYNVVLYPRSYSAFRPAKTIKAGETAGASGTGAIVKYSKNFYDKICLVFSPAIEGYQGETVKQVCNDVCGGVIDPLSRECLKLETAVWNPAGANPSATGSSGSPTPSSTADFGDF